MHIQSNPPPAPKNFELPFSLTKKSFNLWVDTINDRLIIHQAEHIFLVVQTINQSDTLNKADMSSFLIHVIQKLYPKLQLLKNFLLDCALPITQREAEISNYIIWTYIEFARGLKDSITESKNAKNAATIFYSLQSLIEVYIYSLITYQQPPELFWKHSYFLYGIACHFKIEKLVIKNIDNDKPHTIFQIFKHLLAIYHCDLRQFRPREIFFILESLEQQKSDLLLEKHFDPQRKPQYSIIDLNTDEEPIKLTLYEKKQQGALRFFTAYDAIVNIVTQIKNDNNQQKNTIQAITQANILQAAKTLSLSQKRIHKRTYQKNIKLGIIGFTNIINTLKEESSLPEQFEKQIKQSSPRVKKDKGFSLIEQEHQKNTPSQSKHFLNKKQLNDDNLQATLDSKYNNNNIQLTIIDYSIKGYKLEVNLEHVSEKVKIGDLIAIKQSKHLELGFIQRIMRLDHNRLHLGIKLLSLESNLVFIQAAKDKNFIEWGILLSQFKDRDLLGGLILEHSKMHNGDYIHIFRDNEEEAEIYQLNKELRINYAFSHIEISKKSTIV